MSKSKKSNTKKSNTKANANTTNTADTKVDVVAPKSITKAELQKMYEDVANELSTKTKELNKIKAQKNDVEKKYTKELAEQRQKAGKLVSENSSLKNTINKIESDLTDLLDERNNMINKINASVPKEQLKSEKLMNRLNWYYKDLKGWERIVAHLILLVTIGLTLFGTYYVLKVITSDTELFNVVMPIILSVLGISGVSFQALSLSKPKKA